MAKRFTDSKKWDDPWFLELPIEYKMLWIHILDKCNHAGIYKVNIKMINFCLNTKITIEEIEKILKGRFYKVNSQKWFIVKFIEFQYGILSEKNRVHNSVINILKKEGLYKVYRQTLIGLKDKDKNKNKDKVEDKDKNKDSKRQYLKYVFLTNEEHQKLIEKLEEEKTKEMISALNDYIGSKGKQYKSHYHTILSWVRMEKNKKRSKLL